jgi:hypothetical protein
MQNISLHNYQDFLFRYIDEELDLRETEALLAFCSVTSRSATRIGIATIN